MAWGVDGAKREELRLALSACRAASYNLLKLTQELKHPEKGPALTANAEDLVALYKKIEDEIERQLNR
jgi:hypothetical protein